MKHFNLIALDELKEVNDHAEDMAEEEGEPNAEEDEDTLLGRTFLTNMILRSVLT
jgi:hypothetical protein